LLAAVNSSQATFILPFILTGLGLGLVFAPMTTVAMQDVKPAMAGAASGVLNTTRQLGAAIGAAAVGAVLQNRLAASLHDQAVASAHLLPPAFQSRFVGGFSQATKSGLQVGRGQTGAALPSGVLVQLVGQLAKLIREVFDNAYVTALRPTVAVAVGVLFLASLSCLFVINRRRLAEQPVAPTEIAVA